MGATDTTYQKYNGQILTVPSGIRYIVTLDADTKLPRGTVAQLVGTMAHPLNHAKFNATDPVPLMRSVDPSPPGFGARIHVYGGR